jgi:hypothetical protein
MKKIITLFAVIAMFGFQGCTGPEGPPGFDGYDGTDGANGADGADGLIASVFQLNKVSFNGNNEYNEFFDFKNPIYSGDVVLIYRLRDVINGVKVWAPIPESHYYDDGSFYFSCKFDFTQYDVNIYLEGFDLNTVPNEFSTNQTFRIVVIPGDDGVNNSGKNIKTSKSKEDYSDYNAVIAKYKIDDTNVKILN